MNKIIILIFAILFTFSSCSSILNSILYRKNPELREKLNKRDAEIRQAQKRKEELQKVADSEDATDAMLKRACLKLDSLDKVETCLKNIGVNKTK